MACKNGKEELKGKTSLTSNCSRVMISENIPLAQNILDYHIESAIYLFWAILQYCKNYLYSLGPILKKYVIMPKPTKCNFLIHVHVLKCENGIIEISMNKEQNPLEIAYCQNKHSHTYRQQSKSNHILNIKILL